MRKMMMNVKTAVGTAPKTEDADYDAKHAAIKEIDKAVSDYASAVERMKAAATTMSLALENVSKAFGSLTANKETPESMKGIATKWEEAAKDIRNKDLDAYIKALDSETVSALKEIKTKIADLKKVESTRNKTMAEYDAYRDTVEKKEKEYEKKGKDLKESKNYDEELKKRDELKAKFEEEDKKYKEAADAVNKERLQTFLSEMKDFSSKTASYFSAVEKSIASTHAVAEKVKL